MWTEDSHGSKVHLKQTLCHQCDAARACDMGTLRPSQIIETNCPIIDDGAESQLNIDHGWVTADLGEVNES